MRPTWPFSNQKGRPLPKRPTPALPLPHLRHQVPQLKHRHSDPKMGAHCTAPRRASKVCEAVVAAHNLVDALLQSRRVTAKFSGMAWHLKRLSGELVAKTHSLLSEDSGIFLSSGWE